MPYQSAYSRLSSVLRVRGLGGSEVGEGDLAVRKQAAMLSADYAAYAEYAALAEGRRGEGDLAVTVCGHEGVSRPRCLRWPKQGTQSTRPPGETLAAVAARTFRAYMVRLSAYGKP